ncbi:ferrous iron transport protein A [Mobilisporobacter senegalensis]|uniref:Ferrous iron transport protein A n=1 Tax=Mobilisporobacter senegalensis TaxID=1329262 RepID=A0A3N1XI43_9FIRM|nr:FeoA domain-containing protein [Mobilisporobacter senegalensis]ROR26410.1 ferrous iron transport protein A [Mobilisporobacter senegalensis]
MTLLKGTVGNTYTVKEIDLEQITKRRLEALGLTDGTKVTILNKKENGSIIFKVRGTRLAIGRQIADSIALKEEL